MQNCKKVTLRLRHCKHGKMSYYLDYYPPYRDKKTMKTIRHEYLGIYIYESPKNSHELAFNKTMEEKAEIIRCRRFEEIINGHIGVRQGPLVRLVFYCTTDGNVFVFIFCDVACLCRSQIQQEKAEQDVLLVFHISI